MISVRDTFFEIVERTNRSLTGIVAYPKCANIIEICQILTNQDRSTAQREKKYPGIFLLMDFAERYSSDWDERIRARVQILIVSGSKEDYNTDDRYAKVINPVLYPITEAFLNCANVYMDYNLSSNFEKIDRPFISNAFSEAVTQSKQEQLFNDTLDGIELRNLELTILKTC